MSNDDDKNESSPANHALNRRNMLLGGTTLAAASAVVANSPVLVAQAQTAAPANGKKPNILVIFGDDIGQTNISAYSFGVVGYKTPNIDRVAKEGMMFTDYYAENSCTAGRSFFITGQTPKRTGLTKVGIPGAPIGLQARDIAIAQALKAQGYATGHFGKNHLGDRNEYLPLQTFKDYPPSQIPASFTIDQVQKNIDDTIEALKKKDNDRLAIADYAGRVGSRPAFLSEAESPRERERWSL